MFHPVRTAATQCYFIKSYICPFLFVLIPLYYFHFFLFPPPSSVALSSCLYLYRWNSIGEVIEKLSCRSGWFVGPVHALIHPAALPHKQNIKQAIPEERKREGREGGRGKRHREKEMWREEGKKSKKGETSGLKKNGERENRGRRLEREK